MSFSPMTGPARLAWQPAAVVGVRTETYRVKTLTLRPAQWTPFRPGQHMDVRLTAPDGYQAQRSYSIATSPEQTGTFDLSVELIEGGEVSPFFHEVVRPGDVLEVRGPIGGPFTWTVHDGGPVLLVAGGSGIVPIMSMLRHRGWHKHSASGQAGRQDNLPPALLLDSSRSDEDIIYREELDLMASNDASFQLFHTLTRRQPAGWPGYSRRVDLEMVTECVGRIGKPRFAFICGPTGFVEAAAVAAAGAGVSLGTVRTERFGPSGS